MQVKQRLRITSLVSAIALLVVFSMLFLTTYHVSRAFEVSKIADDLMTASYERLMLRTDSQRTGNERTKEQLIAKHKQVGTLLKDALEKFPDLEDKKTITELLTIHESIGKLSRTIRENREKMGRDARPDALFQQLEDRLLSQLNMRVYETILLNGKLQKSGNDAFVSALKQAGIGTAFVLLFVGATTLINSWSMGRTIADRVRKLCKGAAVVGVGDLDHHIDIKGDDEFAELSEAFNAMTARLRGSYHDLEKENTERKRTVEALQESERKYSILFDTLAVAASVTKLPEIVFSDVNKAFEKLFGYTREEVVGKTSLQLGIVRPEEHKVTSNEVERQGRHVDAEKHVYTKSCEERIVLINVIALELGGQNYALTTMQDITERKQAEEALKESEEQFRALADSIPNLAWWANGDGYITWYNRRWYDYTGTSPEQMEGWGWQSVHDPGELPKVLERWQASIATGELFEMTFPLRGADSVLRPFLTRVIPLKDAAGRVLQWFGTNTDVSTLKKVEDSLRERDERLRLTLEAADFGTWDLDLVTGKAIRSLRHDQIFGYQELQIEWSLEIALRHVLPEDRQKVIEAHTPAPGRTSMYVEGRMRRNDGSIGWVMSTGRFYYDDDGRPVRIVGVCADITERKQAEERLKASLHEKEVMLKEIHHRVKNNLQVISSLVNLQAEGSEDASLREVLREVTYRVRSMALVHEKLYQSADLASIDFAEYARSLLNYLWRAHGSTATAVRLTFRLEPLSLPVDTAVPCGLILNELAGNALKHAFRGRGEGEVVVSLQEAAEGRISLCLSDNGVGMPEGLDWRQARSLGLRLVQMLAGQLNATVEVSGTDGTKFEITFMQPDISPPVLPLI